MKDAFNGPRVLIPIAGLMGSAIAAHLALASHDRFPSFEQLACGTSGAAGCLEWNLLFLGPFYLIGYLLFVTFLVMVAFAPQAIAILIWLWPTIKRNSGTEGGKTKSSRKTVLEGLKEIIRGNEPNA